MGLKFSRHYPIVHQFDEDAIHDKNPYYMVFATGIQGWRPSTVGYASTRFMFSERSSFTYSMQKTNIEQMPDCYFFGSDGGRAYYSISGSR